MRKPPNVVSLRKNGAQLFALTQEDLDAERRYQEAQDHEISLPSELADRTFLAEKTFKQSDLTPEEQEVLFRIPAEGEAVTGQQILESFKLMQQGLKEQLAEGMGFVAHSLEALERIMRALPELLDSVIKKRAVKECSIPAAINTMVLNK